MWNFDLQGLGAVVGAISRNLHELQDRQGSYLSIYDEPALPLQVILIPELIYDISFPPVSISIKIVHIARLYDFVPQQDPVVDAINAAVDRLTHSTNFLNYMAQHALIMHEELSSPVEEQIDQKYHFVSLLLNLANTFLYMVNTYIIVPTADDYSMSLGAAATVCGIVIGSMAVAQVFSSVYFSAWSNSSYFRPLVFSSIALFLGNTLYALAYDLKSIWILLLGRLLCG